MDEILIDGIACFGYHGVHPEERRLGQRFTVDIVVTTSLREAGATDDVARTISYSEVAKRARAIVEGPPRNLIETVAEEIAATILAEFARAESIVVTVRKPNAPIAGVIYESVAVRVRRSREQPS